MDAEAAIGSGDRAVVTAAVATAPPGMYLVVIVKVPVEITVVVDVVTSTSGESVSSSGESVSSMVRRFSTGATLFLCWWVPLVMVDRDR